MSVTRSTAHHERPRSVHVRHPRRAMLHGLRPAFAAVMRKRWEIELRGVENVPASGPVIFAANHIGFLDGPLLAIVGPRPVHALTKREQFTGALGSFLLGAGQIPVTREVPDPYALRTALRVLRDGGVVGMFPESTRGAGEMVVAAGGAAYLALVTGAPIVPVSFLGTRLPGSAATFPPPGTRFAVSYGSPIMVEQRPWPRRSEEVRALTERVRTAIIETAHDASRATGMELPGELPETDGTSPDVGPAFESSKADND